jgi:hypothetical protein
VTTPAQRARERARVAALRLALAENTAAINRLRMAIAAGFERFMSVMDGGVS